MKGYCKECGREIDEVEYMENKYYGRGLPLAKDFFKEDDYIEGDFVEFWSGKSYNCHALGINVPKYATLSVVEPTEINPIGRIYIKKSYINFQRKKYMEQEDNKWRDRDDFYELKKFINAINTPYIEPEILKSSIKLELI